MIKDELPKPTRRDPNRTYKRKPGGGRKPTDLKNMMYHTAKLFSDHGKNVLIDGILVERPELKPHYTKVKDIFVGYPFYVVEVFCPLDICRQRNIERGDRTEDQSEWQNKIMAKDIQYNCTVNTYLNSSEECAESILKSLFGSSEN